MIQKIKDRWSVESNFQLILIFIVFGITGSSSMVISDPVMDYFSIFEDDKGFYMYWTLRIIIVSIIYQFVLLLVAYIFGQFKWFWNFEKKMVNRFLPPFFKKKN